MPVENGLVGWFFSKLLVWRPAELPQIKSPGQIFCCFEHYPFFAGPAQRWHLPARLWAYVMDLQDATLGNLWITSAQGGRLALILSLMNILVADQAPISLNSAIWRLNLAHLRRCSPQMGTPRPQSCPA